MNANDVKNGGDINKPAQAIIYQVLLFDEVEKAHSDVFNLLLQVLDEGHLTDSQGTHVNFKNTLIILTSNLGSEFVSTASDKKHSHEIKNYCKYKSKPAKSNPEDRKTTKMKCYKNC
mgnify:CR=1 FL=1